MLDTKLLQALDAVISEQSFEKAAKKLFLTQSAVSQRIRQLEERVGQMLVVRSSPTRATPAGLAVARHFRQLVVLEQNLFAELTPDQGVEAEIVRLAVNADSLDSWFLHCLEEILAEGRVLVDVIVDDQSVTHGYLRSGEVQGAVTSTPATFQGLQTHDLGNLEYTCVATPGFAAAHFPEGLTQETARFAPAVIFTHKDRLHDSFLREYFKQTITHPQHVMPSNIGFLRIILDGWAYGLVPVLQAGPYLKRGVLVPLAPQHPLFVPHYYQCWTLQSRQSRRIAEVVVHTARRCLSQHPRQSS